MRRLARAGAAAFAALVIAAPARAQDVERGRLLYETHCATCHTERLHHRDKSLIRTYGDLRDEVYRRSALVNRRFSGEELEDIIEFLDRSHYRLDLPRGSKK